VILPQTVTLTIWYVQAASSPLRLVGRFLAFSFVFFFHSFLALNMLLTPVRLQLKLAHRTLNINGHTGLEAAKEAIETLCREFCDPTGPLSPRRISPNPNLIFAVQASPDSPTDDMLLDSLVKNNARYAMPEEPFGSKPKSGVMWSVASKGLGIAKSVVSIPSFSRNPTIRPSNTIAGEACRGHRPEERQE
jgi:hypothetical protein